MCAFVRRAATRAVSDQEMDQVDEHYDEHYDDHDSDDDMHFDPEEPPLGGADMADDLCKKLGVVVILA